MQYCECTNDFVNAIIDDYFNPFEIRKYCINKYEQPYYAVRISKLVEDDTGKVKRKYTYLAYFAKPEMAYTYLAEYNKRCGCSGTYEILGLSYFCRDVREMEEIPKIA